MSWVEKIAFYYANGLWDRRRVLNAVGKVITQAEADLILGAVS